MTETIITTTSTEGLTPLGSTPQRSFDLIYGTVRSILTDQHANLFSEPVATQYSDKLDWYAAVDGTPRHLNDLNEEEINDVTSLLDRLIADISAKATELLNRDNLDDQRLGEALSNAINFPGTNSIYVIGKKDTLQPIIINWAWVADNQRPVAGDLSDVKKKPLTTPQANVTIPAGTLAGHDNTFSPILNDAKERFSLWWLIWIGWLILFLMISGILYLIFEACAINPKLFPNYCSTPNSELTNINRQSQALRNQIASVEREIGIARRTCYSQSLKPEDLSNLFELPSELIPPDVPQEPSPPEPRRSEPNEFNVRREATNAQTGDLTFSLIWNSQDDLDIHVICPSGSEIWFRQTTACNGYLDVDSNSSTGDLTPSPIENIYFINPVRGTYRVKVRYFKPRTRVQARPFQLQITDSGASQTLNGSVSTQQREWIINYIAGAD